MTLSATTRRNTLRRSAVVVAWLLVLLALVSTAHAGSSIPDANSSEGFSVDPLRFDITTSPGKSSQHQITVVNSADNKMSFSVSKQDVVGNSRDPYANPVLTGGETDSSISGYDWITSLPNDFTLEAGKSKSFSVKVKVPSGATGGHYAAVTVAASGKNFDSGTVESRVAVLFMMNAGGTAPPEVVIDDVYVNNEGETVVDYINEGDTEVTPEATVTYVDPITGETVAVYKSEECTTTLPDGMGECVVKALDESVDSKSGLLKPEVELANDGRKAKAALPTQWSGSWMPLILPVTGLGMLAIFFWRRRRRTEDPELELPL